MDLSSLGSYLSSSKEILNHINKSKGDVQVVLGNEAADLDSVVSAIVYAYYLALSVTKEEKENKREDEEFIFPVINCKREDLGIRTEVTYFLKQNEIQLAHLICRDEIELGSLSSGGRLKLTLVDHNVLSGINSDILVHSIVRVIDHHRIEREIEKKDTIELVGSCSTLIAEISLHALKHQPNTIFLLYGVLVLDTVNFSPDAGRVTPKDRKIAKELEDILTKSNISFDRDEIFNSLSKARENISTLSAEEILKKDCKVLKTLEISIVIPAVPILSDQLLEWSNIMEALRGTMRKNRSVAVLVMGYSIPSDPSGKIKRDITIFSDSIHKLKQVSTPLENCEELQLKLYKSSIETHSCLLIYQQQNVTLSRKFILPYLANHFKNQNQLDVESAESSCSLLTSPVPSISYTSVQSLGIGDPISQCGSSVNSAYNSCPYTPLNSSSSEPNEWEKQDASSSDSFFLPSFNSRDMIEKIQLKRGKLRGYEKSEDELKVCSSSYPFTPKNSYVESSFESLYEQHKQRGHSHMSPDGICISSVGGVMSDVDSEVLLRKLMEKRHGESLGSFSSSNSSKSQSLTKLNEEN